MTLSAAEYAQANASSTAGEWFALLTISHDDISTLRYAAAEEDVTSNGNVFTALGFDVRLPGNSGEPPAAQIVLDNVDLSTITAVRSITDPADIQVDIVRRSAPDTIVRTYPNLKLLGATIVPETVSLDLGPDPVFEESYPGTEFTPDLFPGLFEEQPR